MASGVLVTLTSLCLGHSKPELSKPTTASRHLCENQQTNIPGQDTDSDRESPQQLLERIIEIAKDTAINKDKVDWDKIELQMRTMLGDATRYDQLAKPTQYLLYALGDYHGAILIDGRRHMAEFEGKAVERDREKGLPFDLPTVQTIYRTRSMSDDLEIQARMLDSKIAYLEIPTMSANSDQIHPWALKIREALDPILDQHPKGLIIDLRTNLGGNMHPMFGGIGRVFPNIDMGGQSWDGKRVDLKWSLRDGNPHLDEQATTSLPKIKDSPFSDLPVAVLTSRYTCSSGEAVASGLYGQSNVRLFGEHTSGFSTSNDWFQLNAQVAFSPAVGYYVSRDGTVHHDGITPQVEIEESHNLDQLTQGKTIDAAVEWILTPRQ